MLEKLYLIAKNVLYNI